MPREMVVLFLSLFSMAGATVLLYPLVRAVATRIQGGQRVGDTALKEELQALREDLIAEIHEARREIGDLGERVDFTERLLAKKSQT